MTAVVSAPGGGVAGGTTTPTNTGSGATSPNPGLGEQASIPFKIVPSEIRSWISLNRGSLPEPPFSMEISFEVEGITSAGDLLVTNKAYVLAEVLNDVVINPNVDGGTDTNSDTITEGGLVGSDGDELVDSDGDGIFDNDGAGFDDQPIFNFEPTPEPIIQATSRPDPQASFARQPTAAPLATAAPQATRAPQVTMAPQGTVTP
jgi:hypothetical protein